MPVDRSHPYCRPRPRRPRRGPAPPVWAELSATRCAWCVPSWPCLTSPLRGGLGPSIAGRHCRFRTAGRRRSPLEHGHRADRHREFRDGRPHHQVSGSIRTNLSWKPSVRLQLGSMRAVALPAHGRQPIAGRQRGRANALGSRMQDDPDWPEAATILAHDPQVLRRCGRPAGLPDLAVHLRILRADARDLRRPDRAGGLHPGRQPDHGRVRGQARPAGGGRGRARLRQRHGRDQRGRARARCRAATGSSACATSTPTPTASSRCCCRAWACAVDYVDGRDLGRRGARPGGRPRALSGEPDQLGVRGPGPRDGCRRWPAAKASRPSSTTAGRARSSSARSRTAPTSSCTRPRSTWAATATRWRAWWPAPPS